ncbi:MAG: CotH kinase family protein [Vicinamibacterales bacterium]
MIPHRSMLGVLLVAALTPVLALPSTPAQAPPLRTPAPSAATPVSAKQARARTSAAKVYDTSVLHRIDITMSDSDARSIVKRTKTRVRARFVFDGVTLDDVGIRQAGGVYFPYVSIGQKPSLSIKFDEFVSTRTLFGLDKIVLKNERQDYSLVNEHLTYEVFRRAGLAASLTAHARVTLNGIDDGIYLMREPVDGAFLMRNFGENDGDLYEIENKREFVTDPGYPSLRNDGRNGRNRNNLLRLAAAVRSTGPKTFVADLAPLVDIDRLITHVAAEMATGHWDGLTFRNNNTYLYVRESDGRFIFIPYGADQAFGGPSADPSPSQEPPMSMLVKRLVAAPGLLQRVQTEASRMRREPVWNQRALLQRLKQVGEILAGAGTTGRTGSDVERFLRNRGTMVALIRSGGG